MFVDAFAAQNRRFTTSFGHVCDVKRVCVCAMLSQLITGVFVALYRHVCGPFVGKLRAKYGQKADELRPESGQNAGRKRAICDAFAAHLRRENARISVVFPR